MKNQAHEEDLAGYLVGENEPAAALLERRWFAVYTRIQALRIECAKLRDEMQVAEANWRHAHSALADLEALHDAFAHQFAALHQSDESALAHRRFKRVMSAA